MTAEIRPPSSVVCPLIDSHCHLDFPDFAGDLDGVVARARTAGVARMVTISTRISRHAEVLAIAERFPDVYCSVGTHPHHAHDELDIDVDELVARTHHGKVVAIGEAGLDYHYDFSPREAQARGFRNHIAAARATGLPLVIHSREADEDTASILEQETAKGAFPAVLHCFTGGRDLARRAIALGCYISFTGILTFKGSHELRAIAERLPGERVLVETDAPYLAPGRHRGRRNEPGFVVETARVLAETRGVPLEAVARETTENFFRLFTKVARPAEIAADPAACARQPAGAGRQAPRA
jgi:TatD DNase family protein